MLKQYSVRAIAIPKEVRATRNRKWNYLNDLLQSQFVKPWLLGTDGFDT